MDKAREYAEKGVDIYNPEDPFFNDKCHKIDIDMVITIKDRREDIFKNVSFCEDNCKYNGMDYILDAAICSCDAEMLQDDNDNDEKLNVNNMIKAFTSELLSFNFDVMKCINLVFDNKILIKNIGFYTYIIMIITQICILVFFLLKKITPIRVFIVNIINSNPPRKSYINLLKRNSKKKTDNNNNNINVVDIDNKEDINKNKDNNEIKIENMETIVNNSINDNKNVNIINKKDVNEKGLNNNMKITDNEEKSNNEIDRKINQKNYRRKFRKSSKIN
jgi:hypothetical protein